MFLKCTDSNLHHSFLNCGDNAVYISENILFQSAFPIFQNGKQTLAANYRPISLTTHMINICESLVRSRKSHFGNRREILEQILHHLQLLRALGEDSNNDVMYPDFNKVFGWVDHKMLLKKVYQRVMSLESYYN